MSATSLTIGYLEAPEGISFQSNLGERVTINGEEYILVSRDFGRGETHGDYLSGQREYLYHETYEHAELWHYRQRIEKSSE